MSRPDAGLLRHNAGLPCIPPVDCKEKTAPQGAAILTPSVRESADRR